MRKEQYTEKENFFKELMDNPDSEKFHRLIRMNKANRNTQASYIGSNNQNLYNTNEQTKCFSKYFKDLAIPQDNNYDNDFHELCNMRHSLIQQYEKQSCSEPLDNTSDVVASAIKKLNSRKAADEFGISSEHLKNSPYSVTTFLTNIFGKFLKEQKVPGNLKSGILSPVLKTGKDASIRDNYRGITVTPIISKLFESSILPGLSNIFLLSTLQFCLSEGLCMLMAAFIINEARAETKHTTFNSLFLMTVDRPKTHTIGLKIGTTYAGCQTCADIAVLSSDLTELQTMVSIAIWHSKQDRVTLHPEKTKAIILNKSAKLDRSNLSWTLDNTIIIPVQRNNPSGNNKIRTKTKQH
ncbi:unnamed protein product [Mytilus coruscus]|uniref:Reverse transcriptase domain-containing protein n=1 Tax=Mytilus coruscus TaxID=42192 RepID=A0A6J8DX50_MYTCO|nr:unnamed protein product [Mytilus coruscus]